MLKLVGTDGDRYYSFEIRPGKHMLGRSSDNLLYVPNRTISRKHAEIELLSSGECTITDLGSHNGTFVNGHQVSALTEVKPGDTVMFGSSEFRLTSGDESSAIQSTPIRISTIAPEKSVYLSLDEALRPLPTKATEIPGLFAALSEMAKVPAQHEQQEEMLKRSLDLVNQIIPAERLAILFTGEKFEDIFPVATLLSGGKDLGEFTLSRTIVADILSGQQAVLVGNPLDDPRYSGQKSIVASNLKSAMAVPLFDEGNVLGILYVDTTNPIHRYNNDYLRVLATFGNIIASRLININLMEERQERKIIDAELKRAASIQKRLLATGTPAVERFSVSTFQDQCRAVGGDLYDVTMLPQDRLLFLVGDVSGKGLGAALLMSNILASIRILYDDENFDLSQVVTRVSRELFTTSDPGDFATLFVGVVDIESNMLTYVNAGHNPPFVVHADWTVENLEVSGFMIGAFDFGEWTLHETRLAAGDMVVVFSDGVTEAEGKSGQYGEDRLSDWLKENARCNPEEISRNLVEELERFTEGTPQSDDITLLIVKRDS